METREIIDLISNLAQAALFLAIVIYISRKRAIIITSIWRRINGADLKFSDTKLENAANELIDLEKFQILFPNLKFKNLHQITDYIDWCKNKKISLSEANYHHECIKYKRLENPKITASYPLLFSFEKYYSMFATLIFSLGLIAALSLPSLSGEFGEILLKTKKSGEFLYLNINGTFQNAWPSEHNWTISRSECEKHSYKYTTLLEGEAQSICKLVSNEEALTEYFSETKTKGRITASIMIIILIPLIFSSLANTRRLQSTPEFLTQIGIEKLPSTSNRKGRNT